MLFTYKLGDVESSDLKFSLKIADVYDVTLVVANIPLLSKHELEELVSDILDRLPATRAIDTQVCFAYHYMLNALRDSNISCKNLVIGFYEELLYESNAKVLINYRKLKRGE